MRYWFATGLMSFGYHQVPGLSCSNERGSKWSDPSFPRQHQSRGLPHDPLHLYHFFSCLPRPLSASTTGPFSPSTPIRMFSSFLHSTALLWSSSEILQSCIRCLGGCTSHGQGDRAGSLGSSGHSKLSIHSLCDLEQVAYTLQDCSFICEMGVKRCTHSSVPSGVKKNHSRPAIINLT